MKKILLSALIVVLSLSIFVGVALAKSNNKGLAKAFEQLSKKLERLDFDEDDFERGTVPMSLVINGNGHVRLTRAMVKSVNGDNISVEIWKLNFNLHKMSDTQVFGLGKGEINWSDIKINDILDVTGQLDESTTALIHAKIVHDRSALSQSNQEEINRLRERINELIRKLNEILGRLGQTPLPTPTSSPTPSPSPTPTP
ncbi:MAG: hypothetical protein G01um10142_459 [Parcubacteria group bacterium Gr01-1014_2]|nr:MAG: hypothetical protein G01um10142_459 [Parcubacteria group bacterium Gr01-1014_2]